MQEISKEYKGLAEKTRKLIFSSVLNKILMAMDTSEQFIIPLVHSRNVYQIQRKAKKDS